MVILSALISVCSACNKKTPDDPAQPKEQRLLDSLTDNFIKEASARGVDVSNWSSSVEVLFGSLPKDKAGSCKPNSYPKVVTIDHYYWKIATMAAREQLVFHELAHCLLQRKHTNDTLAFGACSSWMREKDSDCLINLGNKVWRQYYLDELFAQHSNAPSWLTGTRQAPDLNAYSKLASATLTSRANALDSLHISDLETWILALTVPPPDSTNNPTYVGLTVNELSFYSDTYNIDRILVSNASILTTPSPVFQSRQNVLFSVNHGRQGFKLVVQKLNGCAYMFIDGTLKYCLPVENNKVVISGYGLPNTQNTVDLYGPL